MKSNFRLGQDMYTLYQDDNVKVLRTLPDKSVDLTVTSPPYDPLDKDLNIVGKGMRDYKGYTWDFKSIAKELWRVTSYGGVVVWIVDDKKINGSESGTSLRQALYFMDLGFNLHDKMIYEPLNGAMGGSNEYLQCFEMMFVFSIGKPKTTNLLMDRPNIQRGDRKTPRSGRRVDGTKPDRVTFVRKDFGRRKNIWQYAVGGKQELGDHPAIFPEQLALDHIISWSNEGDTVLDPFMGSGTTGKMAVLNNRNFIGIEIAEEYMVDARERIRRAYEAPTQVELR